jgi:transcription initiation factor IIE alpha subunit
MSEIVNDLVDMGLTEDQIQVRLGMDKEEVKRLIQRGNSLERNAGTTFNKGWVPTRDS